MIGRLRTLPRLTRVNYAPRVFGFGATFIAVTWLVLDRNWSYWNILFFAFFLLIYPHLIVLADRWRQAETSLEYRAMMLDSLLLGVLTTHIHFSGWISYTLFAAISLNNTMTGGVRQLLRALLWYFLGLFGWGLVIGFHWEPAAPLGIEILTMVALQAYIFSTAWVFSTQNRRLVRVKRDAEEKNLLFRSLLELTSLADQSDNLEELVPMALGKFRQLYPDFSFGFVLRDGFRPEVVEFADFTADIDEEERNSLLIQLASRPVLTQGETLGIEGKASAYFVFPLISGLEHNQGLLLVKSDHLDETHRKTLQLLSDQLGTSLANTLLTQELKNAAERDALTGILNRGRMDQELSTAVMLHQRNPTINFSVVLMDLIGLKQVNDEYGHTAGDQLICAVARELQQVCRESDGLFRFGGDEFVILCRSSTPEGTEALKHRIESHIQNRVVGIETETEGEQLLSIQLSLGIACTSEIPAREVLKVADERMYADKKRWYLDHERYR